MRKGTARAGRVAAGVALAVIGCAVAALCVGCGAQVNVTDASPHLSPLSAEAVSDAANPEVSQRIEVKLAGDAPLSASGDAAGDFEVLLNGAPVDGEAVKLAVTASADAVTFSLMPGDAAKSGSGAGEYFAVYQGQLSIASARDDGALPHLADARGNTAVLDAPVTATLPSGLAIEVISASEGSAADNAPAEATFEVTSPARARAITWLSLDGGQTKLLKHNHMFMQADAQACAEDMARIINDAGGYAATAAGAEVRVRALEVEDGQTIEPCIVEGFGVTGGEYDGSME